MGLSDIAGAVLGIIDKIIPDKAAAAQAKLQLLQLQQQGEFKEIDAQIAAAGQQTAINAAEAAKGEFSFRDGAGWVCVLAFALMALKAPIEWASALAGHPITLPAMDTGTTTDMLMGLLGLGGMHVYQSASKGKTS